VRDDREGAAAGHVADEIGRVGSVIHRKIEFAKTSCANSFANLVAKTKTAGR
jgi:hypothetical protein